MATRREQFCWYCRAHIVVDRETKAWVTDVGVDRCPERQERGHSPIRFVNRDW